MDRSSQDDCTVKSLMHNVDQESQGHRKNASEGLFLFGFSVPHNTPTYTQDREQQTASFG